MIVADLPSASLRSLMAGVGLRICAGPLTFQIRSTIDAVVEGIALHYSDHAVPEHASYTDFFVLVDRPVSLRRWFGPQVRFRFDGDTPLAPLPLAQAFPMLEWGLNWCIASHCHQYLIMHAAVVERGGRAMILPAPPGSGKSTLCAGLINRGWRLLSDELAMLELASGQIASIARPVSLKNASIDVIRAFAPGATIGPVVHETVKGSVALVKPPVDSVRRAAERAKPAWVVLPKYVAGAPSSLKPISKAQAFMQLVDQSFNFQVHGRRGFESLGALIDKCNCFEFSYSSLESAVEIFEAMATSGVE